MISGLNSDKKNVHEKAGKKKKKTPKQNNPILKHRKDWCSFSALLQMGFSAPKGRHHVLLQIICLSGDHHLAGRLKPICRIVGLVLHRASCGSSRCPCARLLLWLPHTDHGSHVLGIHRRCRKSKLLVQYHAGQKGGPPKHVNYLDTLQIISFQT